jgi:HD-like signal output (HDOD) protein
MFVDDEENVLSALSNLLRKRRKVWDMHFVLGGANAIELMATTTFDVVVSDMRMPGIDGPTLLERVKRDSPTTARVVLSGHADRPSILRTLSVAHQFLNKPCDAASLEGVITRTSSLSALLQNPAVRAVVGSVNSLPSPPDVYWALTRALADGNSGAAEVSAIIAKDPAMSAKMLQMVNSAYFGLPQRITAIQDAVSYMGIELIRAVSLTAHVFSSANPVDKKHVDELSANGLMVARLAKKFVIDKSRAEEAFTAGLLHDLGRLVLVSSFAERFESMMTERQQTGVPIDVAERAQFGATHAEIGAYLVSMWGLPLSIFEAIAHHHAPGQIEDAQWDVLGAVHVASSLVNETAESIDMAFLTRVGLVAQLPEWQSLAEQLISSTKKAA